VEGSGVDVAVTCSVSGGGGSVGGGGGDGGPDVGVAVGGTDVLVGVVVGSSVSDGGGVAVGSTVSGGGGSVGGGGGDGGPDVGVAVGGTGVLVGVAVGGTGVLVGVTVGGIGVAEGCFETPSFTSSEDPGTPVAPVALGVSVGDGVPVGPVVGVTVGGPTSVVVVTLVAPGLGNLANRSLLRGVGTTTGSEIDPSGNAVLAHPGWSSTVVSPEVNVTRPVKTATWVAPSASTTTSKAVPRTAVSAVGVRTWKRAAVLRRGRTSWWVCPLR
jgi:hypothetical protein